MASSCFFLPFANKFASLKYLSSYGTAQDALTLPHLRWSPPQYRLLACSLLETIKDIRWHCILDAQHLFSTGGRKPVWAKITGEHSVMVLLSESPFGVEQGETVWSVGILLEVYKPGSWEKKALGAVVTTQPLDLRLVRHCATWGFWGKLTACGPSVH